MAKTTIRYICQNCGAESLRWMGKCANCGEWNTLVEETVSKQEKYKGAWVKRSTPLPLTRSPLWMSLGFPQKQGAGSGTRAALFPDA